MHFMLFFDKSPRQRHQLALAPPDEMTQHRLGSTGALSHRRFFIFLFFFPPSLFLPQLSTGPHSPCAPWGRQPHALGVRRVGNKHSKNHGKEEQTAAPRGVAGSLLGAEWWAREERQEEEEGEEEGGQHERKPGW